MLNELSLPNNFKCGIFRIDLRTKQIIKCDDQFLTIIGYTALDFHNSSCIALNQVITMEDYPKVEEYLEDAKSSKQSFSCNCRLRNRNGNQVNSIIHMEIIDDQAKGIVIDITNYIVGYEAIEQNYQEVSLMSNVSSASFCYNPEDGEFGLISSTLADLFGYTCQEFIHYYHNNFYEIIYEPDRENVLSKIHEQLKMSDNVEVTFRITNKSKKILWIIFKGKRVKYKDDSFYFYGSLVDITELKNTQDKLYKMNYEMNALLSNIPGGTGAFVVENNRVKLLFANEEYYRLLGYPKFQYDVHPSNSICKFLYEKDYPIIEKKLKEKVDENSIIEFEVRVRTKNRGIIWIAVKSKFYQYVNDNPVYYSVILDINERKKMEYEMKLQAERYKLIEEITDEVQLEYDVINDNLLIPSKVSQNKCNIIHKFLAGGRFEYFISQEEYDLVKQVIRNAIHMPAKGMVEFRGKLFNGGFRWYRLHYISIASDDGVLVRIVGRMKDISEEKLKQEILEERLKAEPLTGLLNKVAVKYTINKYLETDPADGCAMLLIDIDNFKRINDTLGHIMGDTVILNIAKAIKSVFRVSDFLGRVGGDEFLVLIKNSNKDVAKNKAKDLCAKIKGKYKNEKGEINVSCSIGISYYPIEGNNYDELFSKADLAMYYSKMQGGDYYISYEEIVESI